MFFENAENAFTLAFGGVDTQESGPSKVRKSGLPTEIRKATCFDHNFLKSTNFSVSRLSNSTAQRDLAVGAKEKVRKDFDGANEPTKLFRS